MYSRFRATVFSLKNVMERHSLVCLFTREVGVLHTLFFGGAKSRKRALLSPWNSGSAVVQKRSSVFVITDFAVEKYHLSFRENLLKYYIASFVADLVLKTNAAGEAANCFALVNGFIDGLDECEEVPLICAALVRFMWRFLIMLGLERENFCCLRCGKPFFYTERLSRILEEEKEATKGKVKYVFEERGFLCEKCAFSCQSRYVYLSAASLSYLALLSVLPATQMQKLPLSEKNAEELRFFLYDSLQEIAMCKTDSIKGIEKFIKIERRKYESK